MKKILTAFIAAMTGICVFAETHEEPIITFKTNIYDLAGASNKFSIRMGVNSNEPVYFDIDCGAGMDEFEVTRATFDSEAAGIKASSHTCNVNSDGIVKIYGDASLVDYFDAEGAYLEWIEFGDCTNLEIIDLQHNQLKRLDLSKYNKLSAIYLTGNTFTAETPLVIGKDHPDLVILEIDIIDYMDPDFDINTFPNLVSLDAFHNMSLTHLDPSNCPNLQRLAIDCCPIDKIDVSKNTNLRVLNIEDSGISEIDLSKNTKLSQLYASHVSGTLNTEAKIATIDLSNNPELTIVTLSGNRLKEIDLSNNPLLNDLYVADNMLTKIDVSKQTDLINFNIANNYFNFATLPEPQASWYDYRYEQNPLTMDLSYAEGTTVDLSKQVLRANTTTTAELYAHNSINNTNVKLDSKYFTYENGKVTLLKAHSDSLYIEFANSMFPEYPLRTRNFKVKTEANFGKPSEMVKFNSIVGKGSSIAMSVGIEGASTTSPKQFFVDPGDGKMIELSSTTSELPSQANVTFTKAGSGYIKVYMPEGEKLTSFGIKDCYLTSFEISAADHLEELSLENTELYNIDLRSNRLLRSLVLTGNHFGGNLTLESTSYASQKNMLSYIDLHNNEITAIKLSETRSIRHLDLSHNKIEAFEYKEFENIKTFDISHNKLSRINVAYMYGADKVNISHNQLTSVMLPDEDGMTELDLSNNCFTLADLPEAPQKTLVYHYAPQAIINMPPKGPGANLSAQNLNGETVYTWITSSGETLTEGTDYKLADGRTSFLAPAVGQKVYCSMTNPKYPEFSGDKALRTSIIEAAGMPTNCIATFTTTKADQKVSLSMSAETEGTAIYIDWSGTGLGLEQYVLGTTFRNFTASTVANANVKVYTYSTTDRIKVFSITGASMKDFDGTNMTDLNGLMIYNAGLSDIKLPASSSLNEISLTGNAFTEMPDLSSYPSLWSLDLALNQLTSIDLTGLKHLSCVYLGNNKLTDIKLDNPSLWLLYASGNQLKDIDLSGAPELEQLDLSNNEFSTIDLTGLSQLKILSLAVNNFTFTTLPAALNTDGSNIYNVYSYRNQKPLDVECINGKVDLSSQAKVGDTETVYRWFIGVPEIDEDGNLIGEELVIDEEYSIENGITTFHIEYDGVMCVMTNAKFPNLYLPTNPMNVSSGIEDIEADNNAATEYYDLQGIRVSNPQSGKIYIMRRGSKASKVLYR